MQRGKKRYFWSSSVAGPRGKKKRIRKVTEKKERWSAWTVQMPQKNITCTVLMKTMGFHRDQEVPSDKGCGIQEIFSHL